MNEKKKVATMTFSYSQNLGCLLQMYALQDYIKQLGYECQCIRFKEFDNHPFETIKGIPDGLSDILYYGKSKEKNRKINDYRNKYIDFTDKTYQNSDEMGELNDQYDIFVAGSDQIWNVHKGIIEEFFLPFVKSDKKKIAYAASFGLSKLPDEYRDPVKERIKSFNAISIRESSGVKIVEDLLEETVPQTIDPVFLLNRDKWETLCPERRIEDKYIFVYPTQISKELKSIVKQAKEKLNCKVYSLFYFWGVDKVIKDADPLDFINYIRYAELVVGSSFHATAFAIIFEKNLRVIPHSSTGARVVNLLTDLGLQEKCLPAAGESLKIDPIDYTEANKQLVEMIERSKQYLVNALAN